MEALVLGGTRFIGRHLVEQLLASGHGVTLANRGKSDPATFGSMPHRSIDRDGDMTSLSSGRWDATIDLSGSLPQQVRGASSALADRGGTYLFVSTTAGVDTPQRYGFTEQDPLVDLAEGESAELNGGTYGGLKVLCERAAQREFSHVVIVRPTYVVGPYDYSRRFTYWVDRISKGGRVLAPGPKDALFQWIDVQDLTSWMVKLLEGGTVGEFQAATPFPPTTFESALETVRECVAPPDTELVWVGADFLLERGLAGDPLPMWPGANPDGVQEAADAGLARAHGLLTRSLTETVMQIQEAERGHPLSTMIPVGDGGPNTIGLSSGQENQILAEWEHARL